MVAALAASAAAAPPATITAHPAPNQISRERWQSIDIDRRPSDIRSPRSDPLHSPFPGSLGGTQHKIPSGPAIAALRNPTTGIAGCCARAASGHAAAAPPSSVMNSRRL